MRLEGAGLFDTRAHESLDIVDLAVFAALGQIADGILESGAGRHQRIGQIEHLLKRPVADRQPQVAVIDRQGLLRSG